MTDDGGDLTKIGLELFPVSNKDRALSFIENDRDLEAQLHAIRGALKRNKEAEAKAIAQIQNMDREITSYHQNNNDGDDHHMMHMERFSG